MGYVQLLAGIFRCQVVPLTHSCNTISIHSLSFQYDDCAVDTDEDAGPVNHFSRWTLNPDLKSVDPSSEVVFFETSRLGTQTHNSGDIEFGADGKVYVTVGESGSKKHKNDNGEYYPLARNVLLGSVVRFNDDGTIPDDNPFTSQMGWKKSGRCGLNGACTATPTRPAARSTPRDFAIRSGEFDSGVWVCIVCVWHDGYNDVE